MNLISLFITSFLAENVVLTKFLGMCPFVGVSNKEKTAFGMGLAVMLVTMIASVITYIIYHAILLPTDSVYLMNTIFIFVIASNVGILEIILKNKNKKLYKELGIYLPLITTNCAVLGIVLLNVTNNYNFLETMIFSIGSSFGFTFVIYIFSNIREELSKKPIIDRFKDVPIALITISIMSLIFARFIGK